MPAAPMYRPGAGIDGPVADTSALRRLIGRLQNVVSLRRRYHSYRRPVMATNVILPALGMAQETGKVVRWLKTEGEQVTKGELLAEIETDKATVELEAPATGVLANVSAAIDEEIPVGQVIAMIMSPGESPQKMAGEFPPMEPAHTIERASVDGHEE